MLFLSKKKHFIKKVLILWYTVDVNLGDYYIYKTVSSYLEKWKIEYSDVDIGLPFEEIAKEAKKCDFIWFAGGGIIERGIPSIILNFDKFRKLTYKKPYGVTGLSIGEFDYNYAKNPLSVWVNNASFFYTRDTYSADILNIISGSKKVIPSADVVFAYNLDEFSTTNDKLYDLGVNFRELPYVDLSGEFQWDAWDKSLDSVSTSIIGIPDQHDCTNHVSFKIESDYSPQKAIEYIAKCNMVVAMRFHVILFAARMGKVPIPINYCPKVERLADQLGISDLILGVHDFDRLEEMVRKVRINQSLYEETIKNCVKENEIEAKNMFENIKQILSKEF